MDDLARISELHHSSACDDFRIELEEMLLPCEIGALQLLNLPHSNRQGDFCILREKS